MLWLALLLTLPSSTEGRETAAPERPPIEQVMLSPPFRQHFVCGEHAEGELEHPGDALGTDCMPTGGVDGRSPPGFSKLYRTDGARNEDWYGWNVEVLAPFDGIVAKVVPNDVVNTPGKWGEPPAAILLFQRADGVQVMYGHVAGVRVREGDRVKAGQAVARVGNNGVSRNPHIHVGALRGERPLQIRWDLRAMAALRKND